MCIRDSHTGDCLKVTTKEQGAIIRKLPAEIVPEYFLIRVNEFNKVAVTPLEEWIESVSYTHLPKARSASCLLLKSRLSA